jgi:hypothetical protein
MMTWLSCATSFACVIVNAAQHLSLAQLSHFLAIEAHLRRECCMMQNKLLLIEKTVSLEDSFETQASSAWSDLAFERCEVFCREVRFRRNR